MSTKAKKDITMSPDDKKSRPVVHELVHCRQRFHWDCGVTCVLMALPPRHRKELLDNFTATCEEEGFRQSTWTIDLCYLLKRFNVKHIMYTTLPGVNENYRSQSYYEKIIDLDRERVCSRFASAAAAGVAVVHRALSMDELMGHVRARGPAIALVDAGLLVCDLCKHNKLRAEFRRWVGGSYRGHYVVITGESGARVLYRDPGAAAPVCAARRAALRRARAAPGTDLDTILLFDVGGG